MTGVGEPIGGQSFDWWQTVISQYANSPTLLTLVEAFADAMDAQTMLDTFYDVFWNIQTAEEYGLDVWGRIVDVSRTLSVTTRYLGFEEASPTSDPFNTSPFYSGAALTSNHVLSNDAYRALILAKALANICDGSIPGINKVLQLLFPGRGNCFVVDPGDMTMTYTFQFPLSLVETAIVSKSGVLPRPTGVAVFYNYP